MEINLNAGETFDVSCPEGDRPLLSEGERIPKDQNFLVKVLKIEKNVVTLGPYKTGKLSFSLPCQKSNQSIEATVQELNPQISAKHFPPLAPEKVEYPLGFFILLLVLIIFLIGTYFFIQNKKKKSISVPEIKKTSKDPRTELEKHILYCESIVKNPENEHFHETYKLIRKFLEKENNLKTRSLTTDEFLGTFRALALTQSSNQTLLSQLEYVLKTSDDVRFAGKPISSESWRDYLSKARIILNSFPKKEELSKNNKRGKIK